MALVHGILVGPAGPCMVHVWGIASVNKVWDMSSVNKVWGIASVDKVWDIARVEV